MTWVDIVAGAGPWISNDVEPIWPDESLILMYPRGQASRWRRT